MNGAHFKWSAGLASLAMAAFAFGAPAQAADLGGDCCADLEERIAELEATTVRKGNRKVSLTVTGWVSEGVMWWDDGDESNVYQVQDSTDLATNITFTGSAQITSDWSAGYLINIFLDHANALAVNQDNDDAGFGVNLQRSFWYLQSKTYGKMSVGLQSAAGDNVAILTDFTGTLFQHNTVTFEGGSFFLRPSGGTRSNAGGSFVATGGAANGSLGSLLSCPTIRQGIANDCLGDRTNAVRYDTPTFAGFSASASWGEDDRWEYALRYANEFGGWKFSTAAGYGIVNGDNDAGGVRNDVTGVAIDSDYFQVGVTVKHLASSLWYHGAYSSTDTDNVVIDDGQSWYMKAGWSPKLNALGTTHFVAEYRENDGTYGAAFQRGSGSLCGAFGASGGNVGAACGGVVNAAIDVTDSSVTGWGLGLVQEIDAASMNLWIKYRHFDVDLDFVDTGTGVTGSQDFDDIDIIFAGAHIFF